MTNNKKTKTTVGYACMKDGYDWRAVKCENGLCACFPSEINSKLAPSAPTGNWIAIIDELPNDYERVMYFDNRDLGNIEIGHFVPNQSEIPDYVTHWQYLPKPPSA